MVEEASYLMAKKEVGRVPGPSVPFKSTLPMI